MFVLDGPGSVENQSASGAESAEGLPLEGHLVIQQFCVCVIYMSRNLAAYVVLLCQ